MEGVSLRDYFAAAALQGMLANKDAESYVGFHSATNTAYAYADAMIESRKVKCRLCGKPLGNSDHGKVHVACANAENAAADRPELRLVPTGGVE